MAGASVPARNTTRPIKAFGVRMNVGEVQIIGPSMADIRKACGEVWNGGSTATTAASPHPPGGARELSAAARKRISDAQKKRWHPAAKRAPAKTMTATG